MNKKAYFFFSVNDAYVHTYLDDKTHTRHHTVTKYFSIFDPISCEFTKIYYVPTQNLEKYSSMLFRYVVS